MNKEEIYAASYKMYKANVAILADNPLFKWHPSKDAPNSFTELIRVNRSGVSVPINSQSCNNSIYEHAWFNVVNRAVHDMLHLQHTANFSLQGEHNVSERHSDLFYDYIPDYVSSGIRELHIIDTMGQAIYHFLSNEYVMDQLAFAEGIYDEANKAWVKVSYDNINRLVRGYLGI